MGTTERVGAFIPNIIETSDIRYAYPRLWRIFPRAFWDIILALLPPRWGFKVMESYSVWGHRCYTILVLLTGAQIVRLPRWWVLRRIRATYRFAHKRLGVTNVGIGSLIKSVTDGGQWLKDQVPTMKFTHGDAYSVAIVRAQLCRIFRFYGLSDDALVVVVGAYGKIGSALSVLLARGGYNILLMGRKLKPLCELQDKIGRDCGRFIPISTDFVESISRAAISVLTTSHPGALVTRENVRNSTIYLDVSQPPNFIRKEFLKCRDKGVVRIDGAFARLNESIQDMNFMMRLDVPTVREQPMYACAVELFLITGFGIGADKDHLGPIDLEFVEKIDQIGQKAGVGVAELSNFLELI